MTGQEFRQRRRSLGVTQDELATAFEVSRRSVLGWERGEVPVSRIAALALAYVEEHPEIVKA